MAIGVKADGSVIRMIVTNLRLQPPVLLAEDRLEPASTLVSGLDHGGEHQHRKCDPTRERAIGIPEKIRVATIVE